MATDTYGKALADTARERILREYRDERRLGHTPAEAAYWLRNLYANTATDLLTRYGPQAAELARQLWVEADKLTGQIRHRRMYLPFWSLGRITYMPASLDRDPELVD